MKLGNVQEGVLRSLARHGAWYPGCGWIWSNLSTTERALKSLEKRGLVVSSPLRSGSTHRSRRYEITEAGRKELT